MEPTYEIIDPLYDECLLIRGGYAVSLFPTPVLTDTMALADLVVIELEPITSFYETPEYSEANSSALLFAAGKVCASCPLFVFNRGKCMPIEVKRQLNTEMRPQPVVKTNWGR